MFTNNNLHDYASVTVLQQSGNQILMFKYEVKILNFRDEVLIHVDVIK